MGKLKNAKHELFCNKYITRLNGRIYNGTHAAIAAGYSERTARTQASKLLTNPNIKARIEELKQAAMERIQKDQYTALDLIMKAATDDIGNYLRFYQDEIGNIKIDIKDSATIDTSNIQEVKIGKDGQFSFKLVGKDKAREELARYVKLFNDEPQSEANKLDELIESMTNVAKAAVK